MMVLDDTMADRQAQAGSLDCGLRRVERLKDQIYFFSRNAYTGVFDSHCDSLVFLPGAYRDHLARLEAGVRRIGQQIKKDLFDLVRNRRDRRQPLSIVQHYGNPFILVIALTQQQQGVNGYMHIHHHLLAR